MEKSQLYYFKTDGMFFTEQRTYDVDTQYNRFTFVDSSSSVYEKITITQFIYNFLLYHHFTIADIKDIYLRIEKKGYKNNIFCTLSVKYFKLKDLEIQFQEAARRITLEKRFSYTATKIFDVRKTKWFDSDPFHSCNNPYTFFIRFDKFLILPNFDNSFNSPGFATKEEAEYYKKVVLSNDVFKKKVFVIYFNDYDQVVNPWIFKCPDMIHAVCQGYGLKRTIIFRTNVNNRLYGTIKYAGCQVHIKDLR